MPKNTAQPMSRTNKARAVKLERIRADVMEDDGALFGRAVKALGNCRFRIILSSSDRSRLSEVEARIGGKSITRIQLNDIVIVEKSDDKYYISGSLDNRRAAKLTKEKRLHPALLVTGDLDSEKIKNINKQKASGHDVEEDDAADGFMFDYEASAAAPTVASDDEKEISDDFDIDKI